MAKDKALTLGVVALGALLLWQLYSGGHTPSVTADERAWGDISYSPYAHWMHMQPGGYTRHFPETVGANCLVQAIQNESLGLAVPMTEVDCGSYPQ